MQQKLTIPNKRGEKLVGILHDAGSSQLVVLCHGFRSTKEYKIMVNFADALGKEGISTFRFDFSGNGESEGSFQYANYYGEVEDLRSVVEYFVGLNRSTITVLGHSKGGDAVLLYASKYHDIPAVVNLSGRYDLKHGIEERLGKDIWERLKKDGFVDVKTKTGEVQYQVTEESMTDRLNTNVHEACLSIVASCNLPFTNVQYQVTEESMTDRLNTNGHEACLSIDASCKVLTVHGSADEVIPVDDAKEFAKIIPNHQLRIIEGANHGYSSHQDELVSAVLPFLKECIQHLDHASS